MFYSTLGAAWTPKERTSNWCILQSELLGSTFMLSTAFGLITNIAKPHGSVVPLILLVSDHPKITRDLPLKRARYASNQCSIIDLINTLLVQWHKVN